MAITNVEAVRWCNEKARPAADHLAQAYYYLKAAKEEYDANNLGAIFSGQSGETVSDGSDVDGRHPLTGNDVLTLVNLMAEFLANMEATTNQDLNTALNAAVNVLP